MLTDSQQTILNGSTEFVANSRLDVVTGDLLVLLEDSAQLLIRSGDQDRVEGGLFGAPVAGSSLEEGSSVDGSGLLIDSLSV